MIRNVLGGVVMNFLLCGCAIAMSIFCFADIPLNDGRVERAKYVSSLISPGDIGVEIGVWQGAFAYHVLLQKEPSKLYLVDPWEKYSQSGKTQLEMDKMYEQVCGYFMPYENVEIVRLKSEDAVTMFPDDYFDYVYIDGVHSYAAVTRDLANYLPKVKVGGHLIGDDYGWTGIKPAVQDFLKAHKKDCRFLVESYVGRAGGQFAIKRIK